MLQWNMDPPLLLALGVAGFALWHVANASGRAEQDQPVGAFSKRLHPFWAATGWAMLVIAFVSPLCALASALFSARVLHHILLISFAAPAIVLVLGNRLAVLDRLPLSLAFLLHTALVWIWHAPQPYELALSDPAIYWLMELSLLGSAVWLWRGLAGDGNGSIGQTGAAIASALGTILQMGMLGALLTFARAPLYAVHFTTTAPFGLSPLEDQQLAGLLMWVPAALPYLAVALWRLYPLLDENEAASPGEPQR